MWCSNLFWLYWYTKQIQKCINFIVCFRSPFQSFPLWVMNSWAVIDTMKTVENLVYWKPFLVICPKSHFASIKDLHIQSEFSIHYLHTKKRYNSFIKFNRAAIWRFKEENRALMRRLYGDMESSTVYREMKQLSDFADEDMDSSRSSIVLGMYLHSSWILNKDGH